MALIDIELKAQKLREQLHKPISKRLKLILLSDFLFQLLSFNNNKKYISFFIEFEPSLLTLIQKREFSSFTPGSFDNIIKIVNILFELEIIKDTSLFQQLLVILSYEKDKVLYYIGEKSNYKPTDEIKEYNNSYTNSINIVLVEIDDSNHNSDYGEIQKLNLQSEHALKGSQNDIIKFHNIIDDNDTKLKNSIEQAIETAKKSCYEGKFLTNKYNFEFCFEKSGSSYGGSSLAIGAVCLAYNAIFINELNNFYYRFKKDTCYTGEIDKKGNLNKLDNSSLTAKLKTVFFSPYEKFVIPEDNLVDAKEYLKKLNEKHPNRNLELIPIKNFERILDNLYLVDKCNLKFHQKLKINIKRNERKITIAALGLSLLILGWFIFAYLIPHLNRNPVYGKYEDDRYKAFNKHDIKIWESGLMENCNKSLVKNGFKIVDLDNDGKNEMIYIQRSDTSWMENRSVYCLNSDGTQRWVFKKPVYKIFYGDEELEDNFRTFRLDVLDFNMNDYPNIICAGFINLSGSAYSIMKLNFKGELVSEFINSGFLEVVKFYDISGNGKPVLVASDCNNKLGKAALVVFDPDFIDGVSPLYNPLNNDKQGLEKYYILFPRSILNRVSGKDINNAQGILQDNKIGLKAIVYEANSENNNQYGFIFYNFDKDMNLINVEFGSEFIGKYEEYLAGGKIKQPIDFEKYAISLKDSVLWWDGNEFVNHRAENKYYQIAKDSVEKAKK